MSLFPRERERRRGGGGAIKRREIPRKFYGTRATRVPAKQAFLRESVKKVDEMRNRGAKREREESPTTPPPPFFYIFFVFVLFCFALVLPWFPKVIFLIGHRDHGLFHLQ